MRILEKEIEREKCDEVADICLPTRSSTRFLREEPIASVLRLTTSREKKELDECEKKLSDVKARNGRSKWENIEGKTKGKNGRVALEKYKNALGPWFSSLISRPAPMKHSPPPSRPLLAHPSSDEQK